VLSAAAGASALCAQPYEPLPDLEASAFFDAAALKGPNYEVENAVVTDGMFNTYTITSPFGTFQPQGTSLARIRISEIGAIAQLKEVDKIAVAAGAAVDSVINMGKGTLHLVTNPVDTVTGIGGAAGRLFGRIGRGVRRTSERIASDGGTSKSDPPKSTGARVADASGAVAKDLLGVNRAMRFWAQKLGVDPYTHNPVLRDELEEVANYDAGGRFSTKVMPFGIVGAALGTASTVNSLVWTREPDALITLNEDRLKAMGVASEDSRAFRLNPQYTLTVKTRLVASLDTLTDVTGRPEFVARAATVETEADALFYQESASMAETFHRTEAPLIGIAPDLPGACMIAKGNRLACLYPLDYVVWTETVAGYADRITQYAETAFPTATRELWLTGRVSARASEELKQRGWNVHPNWMEAPPAVSAGPAGGSQ
jgi:hypothetical protein